jgi:hypothetical protein
MSIQIGLCISILLETKLVIFHVLGICLVAFTTTSFAKIAPLFFGSLLFSKIQNMDFSTYSNIQKGIMLSLIKHLNFDIKTEDKRNLNTIDVASISGGLIGFFIGALLNMLQVVSLLVMIKFFSKTTQIDNFLVANYLFFQFLFIALLFRTLTFTFLVELFTFSKLVSISKSYDRFKQGFDFRILQSAFFTILITSFGFIIFAYNIPLSVTLFFITFICSFINAPLIKHSILRLCLYLEGSMPIKYATFLDLAAEARILEKDGGHWRFRHQTLQEHFAKMEV